MVNEKHNGTLLVQLGPKLQAYPEELLRQRRGHDGRPEYLVQWSIVSLEERAAGGSSASCAETKPEHISMWMSAEEVCASCPALLGRRRPEGPRLKEEKAPGPLAAEVALDEASLLEMKADVRSLVQRAGRQVAEAGTPECSILSTVHVLGAYASIGSLAGAFRETGALDLLMRMLCHKEKQIRRSAGEMLRALGAHDAGGGCSCSVPLRRCCWAAEGCQPLGGVRCLGSSTSRGFLAKGEESVCIFQASLVVVVWTALGFRNSPLHEAEPLPQRDLQPRPTRSIFQHKASASSAAQKPVLPSNPGTHKKQGCTFLTASDFTDSSDYVEYLKANLVRGMRVRLLEDCGDVRAGEEGEFLQSTNSMHTVQVLWQSTGRTYWMRWQILEIIGFGDQWEDPAAQKKEYSVRKSFNLDTAVPQPLLCKPLGGLYSLPYLGQRLPKAAETLSRAEWWELLFFVRKLEAQEQKEITCLIQQHQGEQVDKEGLMQLSVPAELAQKVLQVLEKRCEGSSLRELRGSRVYGRHFLARGAEQDGGGSSAVSSDGGGCGSTGPEGGTAKAAEGDLCAAPGPPQGRSVAVKSDSQLFSELLEREGLFLPEATEEQSQALGSCKGLSESGSLAELAAAVDVIQSSSSAVGLRLAGLKHIVEMLEEEPRSEQQVGAAQGGLGPGSAGEKLVQVAVQLLSTEAAEKALVAVTLRLLAVLLARHEWRVPFATEGGVRAVLACMQQHGCSGLVQQAGLAALKVLVGAADGAAGGKCLPWNHGDAQMMREIFASIGSASSEGSASLLSSIPAALSSMQRVPGGSSGVQNGLLVVNMLMDGHRGLAEQLASCDLLAVLQSCWRDGQSSGCPQAVLALSAINRLAEHLGPEAAGREVLLDPKGVQRLLGGLDDGVLSKEVVVALERQLWAGPKDSKGSFLGASGASEPSCLGKGQSREPPLRSAFPWEFSSPWHRVLPGRCCRLNRALQHEQGFANRFLPDDEAARALGRTFWEALVNPLVQCITSPDPDGVSPLAWLLSEYLESVELPRRATGHRATFGSCVRRLTQLLVHVDPGGPEAEETRAAGGKEGKNKEVLARTAKTVVEKSRGLWGISQCWRGVVQQQVQQFLEAAGQAPDLAERYCRLYQRLRGATEELFGQQAAFVLALGQGFAGALLQLSFLTALHVSEQFARYLDMQIQELRRAAGSTGPLERLQQFLEPFVVFSGLELAHSFEHFYRLYLGDRLLTQGPSWLEGGIVEQIGLCFPSRFPQDMLSNLAQSEELQRQFCLFQLQEQDKRLLELDTGLDEVLGRAPVADVPEVKVLALSPRCWPVSPLCYMDNPARFFPAELSSPLDEFADFCRQSQSQLGWECTKPRRLQWTWLGHAELQFGDCVLHVSTLQMYILLCFNSAQEVAVEALLQATGLPADLVHHALTPLTHGQGVLVGSCTLGGALRLNQAALAQSSGRQLRLLPQQRYLRTERAEVSALERKRNVLCCLITRILKLEKQLHIDNLVFRVIDACQKGELGPGVQFLSFCCHSVDVLSCILHLLNQGYLQRQEGRPHVLEYISAEATTLPTSQVQPQVAFQTVEIKTAVNLVSAERRQTFSTFR
ncbi:cullin-9-like [Parus major]|uniref:cullin-9-like n=1 Tax=Parus major TaxID=9157 RepID=UPI001443CF36|nr:cullin-9-like [Parus major]